MATTLSQEIYTFSKNSKHLRQIINDTRRCFREINNVGNFNGTQIATAELSNEEDEQLDSILKKPPCFTILGQNAYTKAYVVNEIFSRPILPLPQSSDEGVKWRAVRFKYGEAQNVSLCLPDSFELVENLESHRSQWSTVPPEDLCVRDSGGGDQEGDPTGEFPLPDRDAASDTAVLEVTFEHPILKQGARIAVSASDGVGNRTAVENVRLCTDGTNPVFIYALSEKILSDQELSDLRDIKESMEEVSVFFVKVPTVTPATLPLGEKKAPNLKQSAMSNLRNTLIKNKISENSFSHDAKQELFRPISLHNGRSTLQNNTSALNLFQQLLDLGYVSFLPGSSPADITTRCRLDSSTSRVTSYVESEFVENFDNFPNVIQFTRSVLQYYLIKTVCLLNLVHTRCLQMFINTAFDMARDMVITPRRLEFAKEKETLLFKSLMDIAIKKQDEIRRIIAETISGMRDSLLAKAEDYEFIGVEIPESGELTSSKDLKICTGQIQELVIGNLNSAIANRLLKSVDILKDSYTGVLARCLESLEQSDTENTDSVQTSMALREILNAAYQVEITVRAGSSLVKVLLEKMKQLMQSMPWRTPPVIDSEWKRNVAADMLDSLSDSRYRNIDRLAKSICSQIKDRLKQSHDSFATALKQLEHRHSGRLERTEEQRVKVRKVHAPKVARLVLESTSYKDYLINGMCVMGREVGRGQYGVVYSCESWGSFGPCAIKSVVPPDDKHWNDLALEYYYTKNVPEHDRIVVLRGSVIDYTYGGGGSPAVLLIMDRLQRDLYAAIKGGLGWLPRLQVAIDVVEGIRFLHNQGLVHRDIKLKNVLLDKENRGKITDLGFCKPEAMMSGSIVGTPIHMAPELFSGRYDNSVDVYAFGILFWYVCAGHVKLPRSFEQCANKEMLWTSVRRGVRPEFLPQFDDNCWELMQNCWEGEPAQRPLLGNVEPRLAAIYEYYSKLETTSKTRTTQSPRHSPKHTSARTKSTTSSPSRT